MASKEIQMIDGVGVSLRSGQVFLFRCCDCSLVHRVVIKTTARAARAGWFGLAVERVKRKVNMRKPR